MTRTVGGTMLRLTEAVTSFTDWASAAKIDTDGPTDAEWISRWLNEAGLCVIRSAKPGLYVPHDVPLEGGVPVTIDDGKTTQLARIVAGGGWNGFVCPMFERDEADKVAAVVNSVSNPEYPCSLEFNEAKDMYLYMTPDYDEPEEFEGFDRAGLHLYAIGAWSWTWDFAAHLYTEEVKLSVTRS